MKLLKSLATSVCSFFYAFLLMSLILDLYETYLDQHPVVGATCFTLVFVIAGTVMTHVFWGIDHEKESQ